MCLRAVVHACIEETDYPSPAELEKELHPVPIGIKGSLTVSMYHHAFWTGMRNGVRHHAEYLALEKFGRRYTFWMMHY